jgi:hypothetical protein
LKDAQATGEAFSSQKEHPVLQKMQKMKSEKDLIFFDQKLQFTYP